MAKDQKDDVIRWYRTPIDREALRTLTARSDFKGWLQTIGFLSLLGVSGAAAYLAVGRLPAPVALLLLFVHGTIYPFVLNGFHELSHGTVFKTRFLNRFFLRIFSFLSWHSHVYYAESHKRHHLYTLYPSKELEVVLPIRYTLRGFLLRSLINPVGLFEVIIGTTRTAFGGVNAESVLGRVNPAWPPVLFSKADRAKRRRLRNWARITLAGHALIVGLSFYLGLWMLPVVTTFAPFFGAWLLFLCNNAQHVGLEDNVSDFRLCVRTFYLNPIVRFLYWHMNYHLEHHMYAAVPCYNLGKLHSTIKHDLPPIKKGLISTWREIAEILRKQKVDPHYQFEPRLPLP